MKCEVPKAKLERLYKKHQSCEAAGRALGVSKTTFNIWAHEMGVLINQRGFAPGTRAARPRRRARLNPVEDVARAPCRELRTWGGVVIQCLDQSDANCRACYRGYEAGLVTLTVQSYEDLGSSAPRRLGSGGRE